MNELLLTPHAQRVLRFMEYANQSAPRVPTIPDEATRRLRARLILEEALETIEALGFELHHDGDQFSAVEVKNCSFRSQFPPDLEGIADGCADISVVTIGTLIACGIPDAPVLEEVDASNLAKFNPPKCCVCRNPMNRLVSGEWKCCRFTCPEEKVWPADYGPWRRPDGKQMKPRDWRPPDIAGVLAKLNAEAPTP